MFSTCTGLKDRFNKILGCKVKEFPGTGRMHTDTAACVPISAPQEEVEALNKVNRINAKVIEKKKNTTAHKLAFRETALQLTVEQLYHIWEQARTRKETFFVQNLFSLQSQPTLKRHNSHLQLS